MLTKEQAISEHRKMWKWIAEETRNRKKCVDKREYLESKGYDQELLLWDCFCCQFTIDDQEDCKNDYPTCKRCPIDFESTSDEYMCTYTSKESYDCKFRDGLFSSWEMDCDIGDWEHAAEMADIISLLVERFW